MAVVFLAFMEGPWPGTALADNVLAGELPSIDTNTEVDHFKVAAISSSPIRNAPVQVKITAHDLHGALMTGFTGSAAFNASSEAGVLACTPATSGAFVAGVWSGEITFGAYASTALLTVRDAQGHTGTSNAFAVVRGPLDHFDWSPIATPQAIDAPFTVAIKPQDAGGNMVEEFTGPVQLSAVSAARRVATGVGNGSSASGLLGNQGRGRLQCLYTPAEVGGAGRLMALEFNVVTPGQLATNHPLTIRLKHTSLTNFTNSRWEADGWTTVYQGAHTYTSTGLVKCQFTAPFDYDGTSNLLVDFISSQSPTGFGGFAYYQTTESQGLRKIYYETYDQSLGDPLTWDGTAVPSTDSSNLPVLRFTAATKNSLITPISSGLFSGGLWSGNVSVPLAGSAVRLVAESADGLRGASNEFAVRNSPPLNGSGVVYREGFENGPLSASWELTGTSRFRALIATANAPRSGFRHLTLDANSISEYARNEATWTVDLAGLSALSLKFWAKGFSETADAPPESSFVGGANFDGVAISTDGITWHEVQPLRPLGNAWVQYNVNLDAAIATLGLTPVQTNLPNTLGRDCDAWTYL